LHRLNPYDVPVGTGRILRSVHSPANP